MFIWPKIANPPCAAHSLGVGPSAHLKPKQIQSGPLIDKSRSQPSMPHIYIIPLSLILKTLTLAAVPPLFSLFSTAESFAGFHVGRRFGRFSFLSCCSCTSIYTSLLEDEE
ncbi:hypothetical protein ACP275_09G091300 [Erythranthe tilingii]